MADPRAQLGLGDTSAIAALCAAAEKNTSPGRALRSRGGVLGDNADGTKAKPPQLPGRKKSVKAILHEQEQPLPPTKPPLLPPTKPPSLRLLPPPPPPLPPRRSTLCDWAQAVICNFPLLAPLECQIDGCDRLVHHLCQQSWEDKRGHEEYLPRVCCIHHPNYKYAHEPEKPVTPPRPTINPLTPTSHQGTYSPIQVLPTQRSPAVREILRLRRNQPLLLLLRREDRRKGRILQIPM